MTVWRARSTASSFESTTVTGMPACANAIAMPLPIVPAPTTPAFATASGSAARQTGNLVQFALREEEMPQRERRRRTHEFAEQPRLAREAECKRQLDRGGDGIDQFVRGEARRCSSGGSILCACETTNGPACAGMPLPMNASRAERRRRCGARVVHRDRARPRRRRRRPRRVCRVPPPLRQSDSCL